MFSPLCRVLSHKHHSHSPVLVRMSAWVPFGFSALPVTLSAVSVRVSWPPGGGVAGPQVSVFIGDIKSRVTVFASFEAAARGLGVGRRW